MPKDHVGALSGVTYTIPDLDDDADVEVAFGEFADTLPAAPKALTIEAITADHAAALNYMYIHEGTGAITVTLPEGQFEGDKVVVYQLGNEADTVSLVGGPGVSYQGPQITTGQYTAVTAIWHNGKWVGSPFSFSGDRPTSSTGGEIHDLNGRRYHVFKTPGAYTFMSHQNQTLTVELVGAGGGGEQGGVGDSGFGGESGQVLLSQPYVAYGLDFIAVTIPDDAPVGEDGLPALFGTLTARGGVAGREGADPPDHPPTVLSGDVAALLGPTVGGNGQDAAGPVNGTLGKGGGGGFDLVSQITRPSHVESGTNPQTWVDTSYGAERYQSDFIGETINGDTMSCAHLGGTQPCGNGQCCVQGTNCTSCVGAGACPSGWWVSGGNCQTYVQHPVYSYRCPNGGTLEGTTCKNGYWTGGGSWSNTVWDPCPGGYTVNPANSQTCIDSRPAGAGKGGRGGVVVHYPLA